MYLNKAAALALEIAKKREENGAAVKIKDILKHAAGEIIEAQQAFDDIDNAYNYDDARSHYAEELADILICVLIAAARDGVDITEALKRKMKINYQRAKLRGDKK